MDAFSRTIYVENFPLDIQEEILNKLFARFGRIKHVEMPTFGPDHPINKNSTLLKAKGYAFIEFYSKVDADKACDYYNDLNNILSHDERNEITNQREESLMQDYEEKVNSNKKNNLICDNKYKLLRVMSKKDFKELSRRYDENRFQSLVKAAKRFAVS